LDVNIQAKASDANLIAIARNSGRFVLRFFDAIELSVAHIYESTVSLLPSSSLVRLRYQDQGSKDVNLRVTGDTWDVSVRTIRSQGYVSLAVFSHKDGFVAVGEEDVVEIFEVVTGQQRASLMTKHVVWSLAFSSDDNILVGRYPVGEVNMWDLQTSGLMGTLKGHTKYIKSIKFSPCENMIPTCSDDCTI
jgi:WD40 repeat protein